MAARGKKGSPNVATTIPADPVLLETDLLKWTDETVAKRGRQYALLGRVESLRLASDGRSLLAQVRGSRPSPYQVEVAVRDGRLVSVCTCPYEDGDACKHAVATVEALRFPRHLPARSGGTRRAGRTARGRGRIVTPAPAVPGTVLQGPDGGTLTRLERIALTRDDEVAARKLRARRERAQVRPLAVEDGPPRFEVPGREPDAPYTVTFRHPPGKLASCTCQDYAKNELGTCKHIERVGMWYLRKPKRFPERYLYVWWRPRPWIDGPPVVLRELRVDTDGEEVPEVLRDRFDAEGWLLDPPESVDPTGWANEAIDAARAEAERAELAWDLDPAVTRRLEEERDREKRLETLGTITLEDPAGRALLDRLGFRLHPFQKEGVLRMARVGRGFLADDMGLGKTIQAIVAALLLRREASARRALIVCPASLKHQWGNEIRKACGEDSTTVDGPRDSREEAYASWTDGFLILNYELVLKDLELIGDRRPDLIVLDEAQRIKNWDTKTAKAVKRLDSRFAFVLTGTPLENRLTELHSLVEFLHPRALGPRWRLMPFHTLTDATGRIVAYEGLEALRSRLSRFFLRRERRDVLDQLPSRTDNTFWTELTAGQRSLYRRQATRVATLLSKRRTLKPAEVRLLLRALTSMRMLCNARAQYDWDKHAWRVAEGRECTTQDLRAIQSPKLEEFARVLEDLLETASAKVVVFSQWERMLRLARFVVGGLLERRGERSETFHGGLDSASRSRILEEFRDDPALRVLFSTDAGGLGLNLQESASIVVNLEVPWNPAVLEQRIGRVHRLGQRQSVQVLHFVTSGAIEERVRQVVENKRALFEGLLIDDADEVVLDESSQASLLARVKSLV